VVVVRRVMSVSSPCVGRWSRRRDIHRTSRAAVTNAPASTRIRLDNTLTNKIVCQVFIIAPRCNIQTIGSVFAITLEMAADVLQAFLPAIRTREYTRAEDTARLLRRSAKNTITALLDICNGLLRKNSTSTS
jgi:hypothetical protein